MLWLSQKFQNNAYGAFFWLVFVNSRMKYLLGLLFHFLVGAELLKKSLHVEAKQNKLVRLTFFSLLAWPRSEKLQHCSHRQTYYHGLNTQEQKKHFTKEYT